MRNDPAIATATPTVAPRGPGTRTRPRPTSPATEHDDPALAEAVARTRVGPSVALLAVDGMNPFEFSIACEVFGIRRGEVLAGMADPWWYDLRVCAARPGARVPTPFGFSLEVDRGRSRRTR